MSAGPYAKKVHIDALAVRLTALESSGGGGGLTLEAVQDAVAAMLGSAGVYDDAAGTYTFTVLDAEQVRDIIAAFTVAGSNVTVTHNDAANTLTIAASGGTGGGTALPPGDYVAASGSNQFINAGVFAVITFNQFVSGTAANFDLGSNRWTCPSTGEYAITIGMQADLAANCEYYVFIYVNGNRTRDVLHDRTPQAGYYGGANTASLPLVAGDYVEARVIFDPNAGSVIAAPFRTFASFIRIR